MRIDIDERVVLVTGASRGIGLSIAHKVLESGGRVVISSRSQANLDEALSTFTVPERVLAVVAHVGSPEDAAMLAAKTVEHFGSLDILVNNAGTNPYFGPLVDIDQGRLQKTFEVNLASVLSHSSAAWRHWMRDHGGVIVNIASIGGLVPEPGIGWYNVTKAAVIHMTKQLAWELAPSVRVNAIAPGLVRTELARELWEKDEQRVASHIPLARIGEPDDIASMALMLMSDASAWVTGQTIVVDGGTTIQPSGGVS